MGDGARGATRAGVVRAGAPTVRRAAASSDRRTRDDYAQVGLVLLAESGIGGVTIATACARLGVTKGSFYHHFDGVADLHRAMLEHWEHLYGHARPASIVDLPPRERLDALVDAAVDRDHEVEAAVRSWSRTDEHVAGAQRRLDALRITSVADALEVLGVPAPRARVLAEMGLSMLTGFQTRALPVDRRLLRAAVEEWRAVLHAVVADAAHHGAAGDAGSGPEA